MNITHSQPQLSGIKYPPFKPTAGQRKELEAAAKLIETADELLDDINNLKAYAGDLAISVLNGGVKLETAAPMLWLCAEAGRRNDVARALRAPIKESARNALAALEGVFDAERTHRAEHLLQLCASTEKSERAALDQAGIDQDHFQPSEFLASLRETRRRLMQSPPSIDRAGIRRILESPMPSKATITATEA